MSCSPAVAAMTERNTPNTDWRSWVAYVPDEAFPLTADALLQWLWQNRRVPPLYWDQFRTQLLAAHAGQEWETREAMLRDLATVAWGF